MYIKNNICYAEEDSNEIRIIAAEPYKDRILLVTFKSGEKRLFDTSLITGPAFEILKDEQIFNDFSIFHGTISWLNGIIDIAPETVYYKSVVFT